MKKLFALGVDHFTIPVVEAAQKQGYYVITCDYLSDNVTHKVWDDYFNYSTCRGLPNAGAENLPVATKVATRLFVCQCTMNCAMKTLKE